MNLYFDENMPKYLAEGFDLLQQPQSLKTNRKVDVKFLPDIYSYGAKDEDWLPKIGKEKGCVITQDIHISRRKHELELYKTNQIGIFFLRGVNKKTPPTVWQMVEILAKHWDKISEIAIKDKRPFGYEVSLKRLKRISI